MPLGFTREDKKYLQKNACPHRIQWHSHSRMSGAVTVHTKKKLKKRGKKKTEDFYDKLTTKNERTKRKTFSSDPSTNCLNYYLWSCLSAPFGKRLTDPATLWWTLKTRLAVDFCLCKNGKQKDSMRKDEILPFRCELTGFRDRCQCSQGSQCRTLQFVLFLVLLFHWIRLHFQCAGGFQRFYELIQSYTKRHTTHWRSVVEREKKPKFLLCKTAFGHRAAKRPVIK